MVACERRPPASLVAWGRGRAISRHAALWTLALLVPGAYAMSPGNMGRALAAPQPQRPQTLASADGEVTWDFETGDLRGWTSSGTAFAFQPTRGDNPRARQSTSNHQGEYWVGTYERYQGRRGDAAGTVQGERPQGTLESQTFQIPPGPLSFLVGGGSEFATRVELVVIDQIEGETRMLFATGSDSDTMRRITWDLTPHAGRRGRIQIVDASSDDWGHINVDDIRFASITVPNVISRDEATARRVLEARGLTVGTVEPVESRVAVGRVLTQAPRAGARVEPGTPIDLGIAELEQVTVPNLVALGGAEVDRLLARAELTRGQLRREESRQPLDTVVSQDPAANARVPIETAVDLVVATPVTVLVPDLLGRTGADAERRLADAELGRGLVRREESRQPEGTVLSQAPAASERVIIDTAVNLVVATPVTVVVPDLVGQDVIAVDTLLRDTELRRGGTTMAESRERAGTVLSQLPAARRRVAVETDVDLVVATPVTVLVPNLVGLDEAAIDARLQDAELTRGTVEREESRQTPGTVLMQEPPAGTRVVITAPVALAVAVPLTVLMPDISGLTEAAALDVLDQYELGVGILANRESPTDIGRVLEQWPTVGTRVDIGTGVDLVVAAVETVEIPTVVGMSVDAARQVLTVLRLAVGDETREASRTEDEGTVLNQHPPATTRVAIGSAVALVIAEPDMVSVPAIVGLLRSEVDATLAAAGLVAGIVEQRFSLEQGGIVLSQGQQEGRLLEFGTPLPFSVARDRITWAAPLGLFFLAVVGLVVRRRRAGSTKTPARRDATDVDPEATPAPTVRVRAEPDPGRQGIPRDARPAMKRTVRVTPTLDGGTQRLEVEGDLNNLGRLITNQRRQP